MQSFWSFERFRLIVNGWIIMNILKLWIVERKIIGIKLRKKNFNYNVVEVLKLNERWKIWDIVNGGYNN